MRSPIATTSLACLAVCAIVLTVQAQKPPPSGEPTHGEWGDRGDNTYANPVMPGDFSDLDAIRVGNDYYAISSTLQYSPGIVVLHSRDLVNWRIAGHVVQDLTQVSPELNWNRMNRPGRGIWAGSIRYHEGKYWVYFTSPDDGIFMSTAKNAAGPWSATTQVWRVTGWDDPCPFWDDDGQAWLVATNFARDEATGLSYNIHLFQMDASGEHLIPGSDRIIHQSRGSEANKLYKIDGIYYHYFSEVRAEGRVAMMERASRLDGPWETRQLIHVDKAVDKEPNQGGLVQLPEEHAQVTPPNPAERVVPPMCGAVSGGSCAPEDHAQVTPPGPAERVAPPMCGAVSDGSCAPEDHAQVTPPDPAERVAPPMCGAVSGGSCAPENHAQATPPDPAERVVPPMCGAVSGGSCAPSGQWYFLTHQGTGDWEGRAGVLLPVSWIDGWPVIGRVGPDGIGNMVWRGPKPVQGFPRTDVWASDDFRETALPPEWEWNYQPRAEKWSLSERRGYLRLHAFPPLRPGDFRSVGNVLTQRSMRTSRNQVTALFDLNGMADGQEAGLAHFAATYCTLAISRTGHVARLVLNLNGTRSDGPQIRQQRVWLRSRWGYDGRSQFAWSIDGKTFHDIGAPYQLTWGSYRGDRVGLYTFNDSAEHGYVDIGRFHYTASR